MNWDAVDAGKYEDEQAAVARLLAGSPFAVQERAAITAEAAALVQDARQRRLRSGGIEAFLQEFSLSTDEGLALMCLAEALLRTPDTATREALIAERIGAADWQAHVGHSRDLFVNASAWGLMLTGRLLRHDEREQASLAGTLRHWLARAGEPLIRAAIAGALRRMSEQFVLGRQIDEALARAAAEDLHCSFDCLGEGARTDAEAARYAERYAAAVDALARAPARAHGISIKLSALSPRYEAVQEASLWETLYPRLLALARQAAQSGIDLALDAEEADRLVLSLKLFERLAREPALAGWSGLGLAVQAYQKRAPAVIAALTALAQETQRQILVRLVKGAYWDSEIKRAQLAGRPDYPVYTTKAATDVAYLVCAAQLIDAAPALRPQFATHNAHTLVAVRRLAQRRGVAVEYQRLQGMGEALYAAAGERYGALPVRVYAPVGEHAQLLPYLVRRLLENGANSSFVHRLADPSVAVTAVVADPQTLLAAAPQRHPRLPSPPRLYGDGRPNPVGADLSIAGERARLRAALDALDATVLRAGPIIDGALRTGGPAQPLLRPADRRCPIGGVHAAGSDDIDEAARRARAAQPAWDRAGGAARAEVLRAMADALEADAEFFVALLAREAGKTLADGIAELREAVDFCRYYAQLAEQQFGAPQRLPGPVGECNLLELHGRGVFACISPWNFPLAIFTGQIAAALAAGNAVLAKPAEQTPLVAAAAVQRFLRAGLPPPLLALLPGAGETVGAALVGHPAVSGVAFTGGTETAAAIQRQMAARPGAILPLIAETGGLNALFADTTALREQLIDDVLLSAFGSTGQRCSALRLLFLPRQGADALLDGLAGALATWRFGDPADPATDLGPVIDEAARAALHAHHERLRREARIVVARAPDHALRHGCYVGPVIAELPGPDFLEREVFGPVLHVCRYSLEELEPLARRLAAQGYGLTLGVHSRLEGFVARVRALVPAGNVYVNRSMIGAVVGVQPFGGEGLSGTGPKAGGPHSLLRYAVERAVSINTAAQGGDPQLLAL